MNSFQLDECSNSKEIIKSCEREALCRIKKFPKKLKGLKDPEMLDRFMVSDGVLVTFDCALIEEHGYKIPEKYPGIVMIGHSPNVLRTITERSALKILRKFKIMFDPWHIVDWTNTLMRITDSTVEAGVIENGLSNFEIVAGIEDAGLRDRLLEMLSKNAKRGPVGK